jgi:hypothetical protein
VTFLGELLFSGNEICSVSFLFHPSEKQMQLLVLHWLCDYGEKTNNLYIRFHAMLFCRASVSNHLLRSLAMGE